MAEYTYTRTDWKKGDVLTAEKLNNLETAVAIAAQALGISSSQDSSSENLQLNCAGAKIGPVDIGNNVTVGGSNSTLTTTLYGTLKTNAIESINNDDSVTINNLIVGTAKIDQSSISSSNPVLFNVGHSTINTQTSSISQYNGEAIFDTAKTTLHGQTVIDSEVSTDLPYLLTVGHTSGSGANTQYYGKAVFNTSQAEFYDIVSNGYISAVNENGGISSINASFGWQDTNVDNDNPYYGETEFRTRTNTFFGTTVFAGPTTINNLSAPVATTTSNGLMSSTDKVKMDQVVTGITLNNSEIPKRVSGLVPLDNYILPSFDRLSDGIYTLQMTITDGNPSYEWIATDNGGE